MRNTTPSTARRDLALWMGVLGPPTVWLAQFGANYALASWNAAGNQRWMFPTIALISLLLVAGSAANSLRQLGQENPPRSQDEPAEDLKQRVRFMARLGLWLSAVIFLVLLAQVLAMWFFPPWVE